MVNRFAPSPWAVAGTHALCAKISETPSLPGFSVEGGEGNAHEEVRKRCPPPSVVLASPGAQRSEAERSDAERSVAPGEAKTMPDPEVVVRAKRRQYSAEYKKRILAEADSAKAPGAMGAMLRREGLYSSHLTHWRQQRDGALAPRQQRDRGLAPRQRGPQPKRD